MANAKSIEEQIVMTREGYEKLKSELVRLRSDGRMEIGRQLEEARSFGDLSENAEYHAAKEAQAKMESRILWLESQLGKARVIDAKDLDTSRVTLGTTVEMLDLESKKLSSTPSSAPKSPTRPNSVFPPQALSARP